jgi:hypothetical protein
MRKPLFSFILCFLLLAAIVSSNVLDWAAAKNPNLTSEETQMMNEINGTNAYNYDLELEIMGFNHSLSGYSFRSSGSAGANESARWIQEQYESFGLETHAESFEFTTWDVMTKPVFKVDLDGNSNTTNDQLVINSFQPEHYSWPTPEGGVYAQLIALPMPEVASQRNIGEARYDAAAWLALNTTGKILLVGREIRANSRLALAFRTKLQAEPPAAMIFTWWYGWMSWMPPMFGSVGGRPVSDWGAYQWDLHLPVGWITYQDGQWVRDALTNNTSISAQVIVNASIGQGPHYNVVGKLQGSTDPEKMVIISAHYDSIVGAGFCDNGAGTSGVLELARVFSEANRTSEYRPPYTLVFVAFAGEELGLVGSINYLRQHGNEMKDVVAVINLDCIGSQSLQITETTTDGNGINLQEIVMKAGQDLNVKVEYTEPGGSDQETFRLPLVANEEYKYIWGLDAGISNETRVKSSIMISSIPLFYSDKWTNLGAPGWIHTSYDNSTSTYTLDWVGADRLQAHIQVAGLSVIRVLSAATNPLLMEVYIGVAVTAVVAAILIYVERVKVHVLLKKVRNEILANFGTKELVVIIFVTGVCIFLSFAFFMRVGKDETVIFGVPTIATYSYYGKPFEMIAVMVSSRGGGEGVNWEQEAQMFGQPQHAGTANVLLPGLIMNAAVFAMLAFMTVYVIVKLRYLWEYSHSSDLKHELESDESED